MLTLTEQAINELNDVCNDYAERYAPHYPPIPIEEYEALGLAYTATIPYRWTGDLLNASPVLQGRQSRHGDLGRIHSFDVGTVARLKSCGFSAVLWGTCPFPEDLVDARWREARERAILANRGSQSIYFAIMQGMIIVVGFIPVIGQAAAVLMTSAVALSTGKPIPGALVDAVVNVIPGGAVVRDAVLPAFEFGKAVLEGDSVEEAALEVARDRARQLGGDAAGQAFDLIFAIGRGQDLQEAGFDLLNHWFAGTDLINKVGLFTSQMAQAAVRGEPVERLLLDQARSDLVNLAGAEGGAQLAPLQEEVDRAVRFLLAEPRRYLGSCEALAGELAIPREVARAAFMSVEQTPHGLRENAAFRSVFVDPSTPLDGQSQLSERTRQWIQRKIDKRGLVFTEAEPLTSFDHLEAHLQQRSAPSHPPDTPVSSAAEEGVRVRGPIDLTPRPNR